MSRALACVLPAIALVVAVGAHAGPTPVRDRSPATPSGMETGRLLIRAGRLEHARAFLEQAKPAGEEERIERLFLLGQIETRLGMPGKAAARFETILALRPGLTRVRLDLARAYYLAGLDDKARYHFSSALGDALPSSIEATVEGFLRRIDARKRWSVSVSAAALPETKRPEHESVLIGGVPFRLDKEAREPSGYGALLSGGVSFSPAVSETVRGVFAASAAAKVYERSSWNETTASADLGASRLFDRGSVAGGIRIGSVWTGGSSERVNLGPWIRIGWRPSSSTRLDVTLNTDRRRHETSEARDGWRLAAAPSLEHAFGRGTSIRIEPVLEAVTANERHHASHLVGLGASVSHGFKGGLSVSLNSGAHVRRHAAPDPLFGTTRVDRTLRIALRLLHRSLQYRGFAPYVGFSLERNRSRIPIHEYRIHGLVAGVSRSF